MQVVDEAGAPLAGAEVTARYQTNPGPIASTCCTEVSLGRVTTGADGVAKLARPPFTLRPVEITARRSDWPPQTTGLPLLGAASTVTIALGPPRTIAGKVVLPDDCPVGFLEAAVSSPPVRAPVGPDGRFVLPGMGPGPVVVGVSACGRSVTAPANGRDHRAVTLVLPPSDKRERYLDRKGPVARSRQPSEPAPAGSRTPPPATLCAPTSGELVVAGDFDDVSVDRAAASSWPVNGRRRHRGGTHGSWSARAPARWPWAGSRPAPR